MEINTQKKSEKREKWCVLPKQISSKIIRTITVKSSWYYKNVDRYWKIPLSFIKCQPAVNPFPHIDAFWRLCSRQLFENIVTKEEIAQNVQFLLLPQRFPLFVIGYSFNCQDFLCFDKIRSKSSAAELSYEGKG